MRIEQVTFTDTAVVIRYSPESHNEMISRVIEVTIDGMAAPGVLSEIDNLLRFLVNQAEDDFADNDAVEGMKTL